MSAFRYKAFISYSHADESWAAWLHKALESYRLPKRLAGSAGRHGKVPARLAPVFRDRDELSSGTDLSEAITDALANSEALVIICSPAAAQSHWVNEEIRHFRALGREDRIYCVIVDGDPQAADPQGACFPPALLESDRGEGYEPLAADARKWADGKALAKLKLVAGILGVRLDELRRREQQRKRKLQAIAAVAVLAVAALIFLAIQSRLAEREARIAREAQQAAAEQMVSRFLDQTGRLGEVADLGTRKAFGELMSDYLADLDPADLTQESRRQLGVALLNQGVILRTEGNLAQAMDLFRRAREILQLLVDDSPGDEDALFELSQVAFWIGQVHLDYGELTEAGAAFESYAEISRKLHLLDTGNADWLMEVAYAQSNLGTLEKSRIPSNPRRMLDYYKAALEYNEKAAALDAGFERELADSYADLADAWISVCNLGQAMLSRLNNVRLAASHSERNPASNRLKEDHAYALAGLSWVQRQVGAIGPASASMQRSLDLLDDLVGKDPGNLKMLWNRTLERGNMAQLLDLAGNEAEAWQMSLDTEAVLRNLVMQDHVIRVNHSIGFGMFLAGVSGLAYRQGETALANRLLDESIGLLSGILADHPDNKQALSELALAYFQYWSQHGGKLPNAAAGVFLDRLGESLNLEGCLELDIAARRSVMLGADDEARDYSHRLLGKGYHEPAFMRFCKEHQLCD